MFGRTLNAISPYEHIEGQDTRRPAPEVAIRMAAPDGRRAVRPARPVYRSGTGPWSELETWQRLGREGVRLRDPNLPPDEVRPPTPGTAPNPPDRPMKAPGLTWGLSGSAKRGLEPAPEAYELSAGSILSESLVQCGAAPTAREHPRGRYAATGLEKRTDR